MLTRLLVRNYAIISELDIQFNQGLTIITGETGAGKSILIGALSMVLGKRADSTALFDSDEKCVIEGHFDVSSKGLESFFEENDLDYEPIAILRRELTVSGKSRAFINDTPVNLSQLKDLASALIDIHSQHEVLSLKTSEFRTRFLDACADGGVTFQEYSRKYSEWKALKVKTNELKKQLTQATVDQDYFQFQLDELENINLTEGELAEAQERLSMLENAEEISSTVSNVVEALNGMDGGLLDALRRIESELRSLSSKFPKAAEWKERFHSNMVDLEDVSRELETYQGNIDSDPQELLTLQERVDEILRLMSKHRRNTETELIQFKNELEEKLNSIGSSDEELTLILAQLENSGAELEKLANELSDSRIVVAGKLAGLISEELKQMGMPNAQLNILVNKEEITVLGQDRIEIQFTANRGQAPQDISKIASGGELSRLMLAVKSEMAKTAQLPSIIFDEIDTGVSGDVANRVGHKIQQLSTMMQVFCITHLPQIAAKASSHLYVFKELVGGKTVTNVKQLSPEERIIEIAKMLSNANPTQEALAHAKNLVHESN
jgi:DNA repair protein RecN (Recombination protein N)